MEIYEYSLRLWKEMRLIRKGVTRKERAKLRRNLGEHIPKGHTRGES